MGMTDKQFDGFLRMQISWIKRVLEEEDPEKARELLREILNNLQTTLEN